MRVRVGWKIGEGERLIAKGSQGARVRRVQLVSSTRRPGDGRISGRVGRAASQAFLHVGATTRISGRAGVALAGAQRGPWRVRASVVGGVVMVGGVDKVTCAAGCIRKREPGSDCSGCVEGYSGHDIALQFCWYDNSTSVEVSDRRPWKSARLKNACKTRHVQDQDQVQVQVQAQDTHAARHGLFPEAET